MVVEVLGDVAVNARLVIPEGALRALAYLEVGVIDLAAGASVAVLGCDVPERVDGTGHTLLSVENRSLQRAIHALLLGDVVDLVIRAACALHRVEVEILGVVAFNASRPIEESMGLGADTGSELRAIGTPPVALNAILSS